MDKSKLEKYRQKLSQNIECHANGQCLNWTGYIVRGYGRINVNLGSKWQNFTIHRLAYVLHKRCTPTSITNLDISHLCHNPMCVAESHLSAEPHSVNSSRTMCKNIGRCIHHPLYKDCIFL